NTNSGSNDFSVFVGLEDDGTSREQFRFPLASDVTSTSLTAGDFNNDGRLDVATARPNADDLAVVLNPGGGSLQAETQTLLRLATFQSILLIRANGDSQD